ncbi:MAG: hypothetical protein JW994_03065 [Candidatus Omnitrophica bacterium]|nr:hypothetical protein [Candidatus Omnitrophota bacterium]
MNGHAKRVLVTVKAYPNPSKKYGETVCVAGIDTDTGKWVRIYPIPFRDLDEDKKFKKYAVIEVKAIKPRDDKRPESYRVDAGSIRQIDHFDTKDKWVKRKKIVLPTVDKSFCEILKQNASHKKSLGIFKPKNIDFICCKAKPKNDKARESCYAQLSFFDRKKKAIEAIPFEFRYQFFCENEPDCPGHNLLIIDWEIGQSYRDWRHKYKPEEHLLNMIRKRWLELICAPKNDVYFFVGNMHRFPKTFMVLGVFYPPK